MKIVIAPDSFKESLTAREVAQAIAQGVLDVLPDAQVVLVPMADGGEGTLEAVLAATDGQRQSLNVADALGRPRQAHWGWLPEHTAVVEMASAAGLEHIAAHERDPMRANTYGVGQLLRQALDAGARRIVLTAGGSATNDGGVGMLCALGLRLLDQDGKAVPAGARGLRHLAKVDASDLDKRLAATEIVIATDVRNPLCGPNGASAIFGPQKGASTEMVRELDQALMHWADITAQATGQDHRDSPGAGAAGGLGFAAMAWLGAKTRPGVEVVAELTGLQAHMAHAQLVITGEGRLDRQTLAGKTPWGVLKLAHAQSIPTIALAGSLGEGYQALYEQGLCAAFSLTAGPVTLAQALAQAQALLRARTVDIIRLWSQAQRAHQTARH